MEYMNVRNKLKSLIAGTKTTDLVNDQETNDPRRLTEKFVYQSQNSALKRISQRADSQLPAPYDGKFKMRKQHMKSQQFLFNHHHLSA